MGIGVISSNVSMKVSAAIATNRTTTGTFFTCAANSYAIINIFIPQGGSNTGIITIGGEMIAIYNTVNAFNLTAYVGPSQAVALNVSTGSATIYITGVQFINSP